MFHYIELTFKTRISSWAIGKGLNLEILPHAYCRKFSSFLITLKKKNLLYTCFTNFFRLSSLIKYSKMLPDCVPSFKKKCIALSLQRCILVKIKIKLYLSIKKNLLSLTRTCISIKY